MFANAVLLLVLDFAPALPALWVFVMSSSRFAPSFFAPSKFEDGAWTLFRSAVDCGLMLAMDDARGACRSAWLLFFPPSSRGWVTRTRSGSDCPSSRFFSAWSLECSVDARAPDLSSIPRPGATKSVAKLFKTAIYFSAMKAIITSELGGNGPFGGKKKGRGESERMVACGLRWYSFLVTRTGRGDSLPPCFPDPPGLPPPGAPFAPLRWGSGWFAPIRPLQSPGSGTGPGCSAGSP